MKDFIEKFKTDRMLQGIAAVVVIGIVLALLQGCASKQIGLDKAHNADLWADVKECRAEHASQRYALQEHPVGLGMAVMAQLNAPCTPNAPTTQELAVRQAEIDAAVKAKWIDRTIGGIGLIYGIERGGQFAVKAAEAGKVDRLNLEGGLNLNLGNQTKDGEPVPFETNVTGINIPSPAPPQSTTSTTTNDCPAGTDECDDNTRIGTTPPVAEQVQQ